MTLSRKHAAIRANTLANSYTVIVLIMPDASRQYWAVSSQDMLNSLIETFNTRPTKLYTLPQAGEWVTEIFKAILELGHNGEPLWLTQKAQSYEPLRLSL